MFNIKVYDLNGFDDQLKNLEEQAIINQKLLSAVIHLETAVQILCERVNELEQQLKK